MNEQDGLQPATETSPTAVAPATAASGQDPGEPATAPPKFIAPETVVEALRRLIASKVKSKGHTVLLGFLCFKSRDDPPGSDIALAGTGMNSVEPELSRFFGAAEGERSPFLNPFGAREWLRDHYARSGVFSQLYVGSALEPFVDTIKPEGTVTAVRVRPDTADLVSAALGAKVPLEAAAAFLLRRESFPADAEAEAVLQRFDEIFNLATGERDAIFERTGDIAIDFAPAPFSNKLTDLPPELRPVASPGAAAGLVLAATSTKSDDDTEGVEVSDAVRRRLRRSIATSRGVALAGPPGTGKSTLARQAIAQAGENPAAFGLSQAPAFDVYTAEADWSARTIVGGHFPVDGILEFQPGLLPRAIAANRWLVIDEMNRADLDRVMGPLFSFLAGQDADLGVTRYGPKARPVRISWDDTSAECRVVDDDDRLEYIAGLEWRVIGTYNTYDLGRVFSMGSALNRRWATIPVPAIEPTMFAGVLEKRANATPQATRQTISRLYEVHASQFPLGPAPFLQMARYIGPGGTDDGQADAGGSTSQLIVDGYVLFVKPQLRRLDPERKKELIEALDDVLDGLASELAVD